MSKILTLAVVLSALSSAANAAVYEIDSSHSQVGFRIKHLVGRVPGRFTKFSGTVAYEPGKPDTWKVDATIDPASINTDNEKRDAHLKAPDFFDTAKCPEMSFKATKVTDVKGDTAQLHGDLTMHCVTKPVVLDLELGGTTKDPWGNIRAGFSAKGKINRKDFGIVFNKALDNGGLMLGEDVDVSLDIEATAKKK
jgi:polyisoprenoid-binding protein YceI